MGNLFKTRLWNGRSAMKRPLSGSANGSIGFSFGSRGLLDLGLFARAGENRTWNCKVSSASANLDVELDSGTYRQSIAL